MFNNLTLLYNWSQLNISEIIEEGWKGGVAGTKRRFRIEGFLFNNHNAFKIGRTWRNQSFIVLNRMIEIDFWDIRLDILVNEAKKWVLWIYWVWIPLMLFPWDCSGPLSSYITIHYLNISQYLYKEHTIWFTLVRVNSKHEGGERISEPI